MRWDEETYGLEYDLDVYHIIAGEPAPLAPRPSPLAPSPSPQN